MVKLIFELYVNERLSFKQIAKKLDMLGIATSRQRKKWHNQTISNIIDNEAYIGRWHYGKRRNVTRIGKDGKKKRRLQQNPKEQWIEVQIPAIIDPVIFAQAKAIREQNKVTAARNVKNDYLLARRLTCKHCGSTIKCNSMRTQYGTYLYYQCRSRRTDHQCKILPFYFDR